MAALRSVFEPGTTRWAVRRAQWRSLGLSDADMAKPKIAVVNSSSALSSCYAHLDELSRTVQDAVRGAGGLPFEIRTSAPSDFVTSAGRSARYLLPSRDLIVNDIEVMVEGAMLDGMVCLSSCDKTTPAHLMAAGRLNVPTTCVIGGYQPAGLCAGRTVDIDDVYESIGSYAAGSLSLDDLTALSESAVAGPGVCAGLGTANTMHIVAETLGMAMPGSAPILAGSARMRQLAAAAGERVVGLVAEDLRPRAILTEAAISNAVRVTVAVGGSVNAVRHLAAIATEAGLGIDVVGMFERATSEVPLLAAVRPNGPHRVADLENAGGARALIHRLGELINQDAVTVTGSLRESSTEPPGSDVVRDVRDPVAPCGGLQILRGNLAPAGAIVKTSAVREGVRHFRGRATIFDDELDAMRALRNGRVCRGDVVVLRGMGPQGGPGTVFAAGFVAALTGAGLGSEVAVVTDGELSGLNSGLVVGQVMPEAAAGGPLAAVRTGDEIVIDLDNRTVSAEIGADQLATRLGTTVTRDEIPASWLAMYRQLVQPLETTGAVLGNRDGNRRALNSWKS